MKNEVARNAYQHAVSKLESQRQDIVSLRNQAGISAAVTGLVATVFASFFDESTMVDRLFGTDWLGFSVVGALLAISFAGFLACSADVVVRWSNFTFSFDTETMLNKVDRCIDITDWYVLYAKDGNWFFEDNEKKIGYAQNCLWWAMVLGWAQTFPWLMLL